MINHGRTLLLNASGAGRPANLPAEEYIDEAFETLSLPPELLTARNILFGNGEDAAYMNMRVRQYINILHSTEFRSYLTGLDSRITYDINRTIMGERFGVTVSKISDSAATDEYVMEIIGDPVLPDHVSYHRWLVMADGCTGLSIQNTYDGKVKEVTTEFHNGVTELAAFNGVVTDCQFRIRKNELDAGSSSSSSSSSNCMPEELQWLVELLLSPVPDIGTIVSRLGSLNEETITYLFTGVPSVFYELWRKHALLPYRLSGLLSAVIYKTDGVRTNA